MTPRLRRRYGGSFAETLWREACGSAIARHLRKRPEETLRTRCGAKPAEAPWRDDCLSSQARRLRKGSGETPAEAL